MLNVGGLGVVSEIEIIIKRTQVTHIVHQTATVVRYNCCVLVHIQIKLTRRSSEVEDIKV